MFGQARAGFGPEAGGVVALIANFRSGAPLISWVNDTFAALMGDRPDIELPVASRPDFVALEAVRSGPTASPATAAHSSSALPKGVLVMSGGGCGL